MPNAILTPAPPGSAVAAVLAVFAGHGNSFHLGGGPVITRDGETIQDAATRILASQRYTVEGDWTADGGKFVARLTVGGHW